MSGADDNFSPDEFVKMLDDSVSYIYGKDIGLITGFLYAQLTIFLAFLIIIGLIYSLIQPEPTIHHSEPGFNYWNIPTRFLSAHVSHLDITQTHVEITSTHSVARGV
ncbi:hypothetical protein E2L06_12520 [Haloterrigena sp. H1]|uniref:hypothetical protein n=1 Tax=Haloterrigena sp. H1 TaxID=2552943 RepID=UPI00110E7B8B|nr:hypothetical protein [Haloterrigena sp. H1]TMT87363.1 hypothetical protein E2L06_12520 [Haloterrigena sp. H1]